jgi:hypothetical protein
VLQNLTRIDRVRVWKTLYLLGFSIIVMVGVFPYMGFAIHPHARIAGACEVTIPRPM